MTTSSDRTKMIAKIHVAKKDRGLTDEIYRAIIERITGKTSCSDCTEQQLAAVLVEFGRLGWTASKGPRQTSDKPWVRKIYALWGDLKPMLDDATEETLRAFVRRQTRDLKNPRGIADPAWLDAHQATKVIQGLEGWLARERAKLAEAVHAE